VPGLLVWSLVEPLPSMLCATSAVESVVACDSAMQPVDFISMLTIRSCMILRLVALSYLIGCQIMVTYTLAQSIGGACSHLGGDAHI
jgi:hypothetical protein